MSLDYITSPNYPNHYPHNVDQTSPLEVEEGKKIRISFFTFSVQQAVTGCYDWLMIR